MGKGIFFCTKDFGICTNFRKMSRCFRAFLYITWKKYPDIFTNILLEDNFLLHYLFYMSLVNIRDDVSIFLLIPLPLFSLPFVSYISLI